MVDDAVDAPPESAPSHASASTTPEIQFRLFPSKPLWIEPDCSACLAEAAKLIAQGAHAAALQRLDVASETVASAPGGDRGAGKSGGVGPQTCLMLLLRGICRFEMDDLGAAGRHFTDGLTMARTIANGPLTGTFLHELSLVAGRRGDRSGELFFAREALVAKLQHFVAQGTPRSAWGKPAPRREPFEAIQRLAFLLIQAQDWTAARMLHIFLRDSCEARNDLPRLSRTLAAIAFIESRLGLTSEMATSAARARWSGVIGGIDADELLLTYGLKLAPPMRGEPRIASYARGRREIEESLIVQYRAIACGLLADRLLRDGDIPDRAWWHQFASLRRAGPPFLERIDDSDFRAFQEEIAAAVAGGRIVRIRPSELMQRTVTINGGPSRSASK